MLEIEILDNDYIIEFKNYLSKASIPFYEDFLLERVVFVKKDDILRNKLYDNAKLKIHEGNFAYQMK